MAVVLVDLVESDTLSPVEADDYVIRKTHDII